ncbi:hypothetical protein HF086_016451 [Spodoptera exigua]|uniref:Uncharacterized protein n=1 Tax=Spodoptera exigua TaxID=7107 RepID=A0A922SI01_SPOEX|nr:hypothetical protein HF086_016451 [Spodoptera exigua]
MSLQSKMKRKKTMNVSETEKIQKIVDNLSDLSDIDTESDDEVMSGSSSYLKDSENNTYDEIEKRLEQLFGIPPIEDEDIELNEPTSSSTLLNTLEEQNISASHTKTPESLVPNTLASIVQLEQPSAPPQIDLPFSEVSTTTTGSEITSAVPPSISKPISVPVQSTSSSVKILSSSINLPYRHTAVHSASGSQSSVLTATSNSKITNISSTLPLPNRTKLSSITTTIDQTQVYSFPTERGSGLMSTTSSLLTSHPKSSDIPSTSTASNLIFSQSPVYPSTSNDAFTSSDFTQRTRPLISSNRSRNSLPKEWKIDNFSLVCQHYMFFVRLSVFTNSKYKLDIKNRKLGLPRKKQS